MIDRKRKIVVIHMPKCAGNSVQSALGIPEKGYGSPRHGTIEQIYKKNPHVVNWPVYLLVRNPFTRLVSFHNFVHYKVHVLKYQFPKSSILLPKVLDTTLQEYIDSTDWKEWLKIGKTNKFSHFYTNSDMGKISGKYQKRIKPIYFEHLKEDMNKYFGIDVPHLNASPKQQPIWTKENVERIVDVFNEDFTRFGYDTVPPENTCL
jgi:hypothetical protein